MIGIRLRRTLCHHSSCRHLLSVDVLAQVVPGPVRGPGLSHKHLKLALLEVWLVGIVDGLDGVSAVSARASVKVVQNMLGHNQAAVTLDVYADLFNTDMDDVAARIDAARNRSVLKMCSNDNSAATGE